MHPKSIEHCRQRDAAGSGCLRNGLTHRLGQRRYYSSRGLKHAEDGDDIIKQRAKQRAFGGTSDSAARARAIPVNGNWYKARDKLDAEPDTDCRSVRRCSLNETLRTASSAVRVINCGYNRAI